MIVFFVSSFNNYIYEINPVWIIFLVFVICNDVTEPKRKLSGKKLKIFLCNYSFLAEFCIYV